MTNPETVLDDADDILDCDDVVIEPVTVPEWGDRTVLVRGLSGEERDAWEASIRKIRPSLSKKGEQEIVLDQANARAKLLVKCIVKQDGARVFTDQQAPALGRKNGKSIDRLYDVATRLSGLSDDEEEAIEGNSEGTTEGGDDSPSGSPGTSDAPEPNS
ncbi:phage tail assembly chaperone [Streptomyces cinnabarinus]|uniref:Phage tail assembly chaperone n=1 Tax=Streptomyces cinnabarinus TaxID=67287 RepID=A0ABY7K9D9_9ACTN|nr:phage tail assembly chaperone [Streptomyces cinnabarinus]WAZ20163.1 phage tail assembly chaperone [Streptomyces cinnabarinus]